MKWSNLIGSFVPCDSPVNNIFDPQSLYWIENSILDGDAINSQPYCNLHLHLVMMVLHAYDVTLMPDSMSHFRSNSRHTQSKTRPGLNLCAIPVRHVHDMIPRQITWHPNDMLGFFLKFNTLYIRPNKIICLFTVTRPTPI